MGVQTSLGAARIGIDLGGTKIEGLLLGDNGLECARLRIPTPRCSYPATIEAIANLVAELTDATGMAHATIGVGIPGSISRATGLVQNANSTCLNGQRFGRDLEARLGRPVRLANDANCFVTSEATDGAAAGARSVFGVILGTGCGGGIVHFGKLIDGPLSIGGEWGHNPLPWADAAEHPGRRCWCGRMGCMETWVSGTALADDHARITGSNLTCEEIANLAETGDPHAQATLARHASRLARGLAQVVNLIDPEVIVLGGGLSHLQHLYRDLPELMRPFIFADHVEVDIRPPRWGDSSGVRGAAWLWA